jgi:hypothetical protein
MRAGDRDAVLETHQLGQHLRARNHRDDFLLRGDHFRVGSRHRRRDDHDLGLTDVGFVMADENAAAELFQPTRRFGRLEVGAGHFVSERQ